MNYYKLINGKSGVTGRPSSISFGLFAFSVFWELGRLPTGNAIMIQNNDVVVQLNRDMCKCNCAT